MFALNIGRAVLTGLIPREKDHPPCNLLGGTAHALNLPLAVVNVDGFGESDEEPFIKQKVKTITIHSVTAETSGVLHTARDAPTAISFHDYYDTYHLLAGYLAVLDTRLDADPAEPH